MYICTLKDILSLYIYVFDKILLCTHILLYCITYICAKNMYAYIHITGILVYILNFYYLSFECMCI